MIFSQELQLPFLSCCCNLLVLTILALQTCLIPSIENTKHKTFSSTHPTFLWSAVKWKSLSCVQLFASPWTIQSVEFSRPEYWSGQPLPSPAIFPTQGLNPGVPHCRRILYQLSHKPTSWQSAFPPLPTTILEECSIFLPRLLIFYFFPSPWTLVSLTKCPPCVAS